MYSSIECYAIIWSCGGWPNQQPQLFPIISLKLVCTCSCCARFSASFTAGQLQSRTDAHNPCDAVLEQLCCSFAWQSTHCVTRTTRNHSCVCCVNTGVSRRDVLVHASHDPCGGGSTLPHCVCCCSCFLWVSASPTTYLMDDCVRITPAKYDKVVTYIHVHSLVHWTFPTNCLLPAAEHETLSGITKPGLHSNTAIMYHPALIVHLSNHLW